MFEDARRLRLNLRTEFARHAAQPLVDRRTVLAGLIGTAATAATVSYAKGPAKAADLPAAFFVFAKIRPQPAFAPCQPFGYASLACLAFSPFCPSRPLCPSDTPWTSTSPQTSRRTPPPASRFRRRAVCVRRKFRLPGARAPCYT